MSPPLPPPSTGDGDGGIARAFSFLCGGFFFPWHFPQCTSDMLLLQLECLKMGEGTFCKMQKAYFHLASSQRGACGPWVGNAGGLPVGFSFLARLNPAAQAGRRSTGHLAAAAPPSPAPAGAQISRDHRCWALNSTLPWGQLLPEHIKLA